MSNARAVSNVRRLIGEGQNEIELFSDAEVSAYIRDRQVLLPPTRASEARAAADILTATANNARTGTASRASLLEQARLLLQRATLFDAEDGSSRPVQLSPDQVVAYVNQAITDLDLSTTGGQGLPDPGTARSVGESEITDSSLFFIQYLPLGSSVYELSEIEYGAIVGNLESRINLDGDPGEQGPRVTRVPLVTVAPPARLDNPELTVIPVIRDQLAIKARLVIKARSVTQLLASP